VAVLTATLPRPRAGEPAGDADDEAGLDNPLTTKEGWRRFVDKESTPPALLSGETLAGLDTARRVEYDETRIEYHADLPLVNTPIIRQVVATSRLLIQLNRNQISARRGAIISGASGTGKTPRCPSSGAPTSCPHAAATPTTGTGCRSSTSPSHRRPRHGWSRWSSPGFSDCPPRCGRT